MFKSIKNIQGEEWQTFSKREKIAEFTHTMQDTNNAFRMIVIKKPKFKSEVQFLT
ncbi:hypothetical protein [Sulfurimonas sp.]